jgi:hypothetical protein
MIFYLIVGIIIGITSTIKIPNLINKVIVNEYNSYRIKLHGFFPIHEAGNSKNSFAETQSITVIVKAENEKKAEDFIVEMIESEFRIEIENIEKVSADKNNTIRSKPIL